ncbi:GspH/FimT family pseudopilin [Niveibacterium sp.]|uniref:GspH/FimT family pseudopilin n=1 Tax=Niveibacterium sp. TaxID=2017444 RepID=UPI0035AFFFEC
MGQKGFTAIELLFVVAITGILLAIAVPSFSDLIARQRIAGAASDLSSDLMLARMEASRRGGRVSVCASTDGATCGAASAWSTGWLVFVDTDGDGAHAVAEPIIKARAVETSSLQISEAAASASVSFQGTGRLNAARTWTVCVAGQTGRVLNARLTGAVTGYRTAAVCP